MLLSLCFGEGGGLGKSCCFSLSLSLKGSLLQSEKPFTVSKALPSTCFNPQESGRGEYSLHLTDEIDSAKGSDLSKVTQLLSGGDGTQPCYE